MNHAYYGPQTLPEKNKAVGDFVSRVIWGQPERVENYCTMGVFRHDELIAGTLYHNWHPEEGVIELTSGATTPRWLTKPVIMAMFHLPFDMLGARLAVLRVSEHNTQMRGIAQRFGFSETIIPKLRGDNEAECVYTLSATDWANHRMNT